MRIYKSTAIICAIISIFVSLNVQGESRLTEELVQKIGEQWLQKTIVLELDDVPLSIAFQLVVDHTGDPLGHIVEAPEVDDIPINLKLLGKCTRRQALEKIAEAANGVVSWDKEGRKPKLTMKKN